LAFLQQIQTPVHEPLLDLLVRRKSERDVGLFARRMPHLGLSSDQRLLGENIIAREHNAIDQ
jgi:hypothetical protein